MSTVFKCALLYHILIAKIGFDKAENEPSNVLTHLHQDYPLFVLVRFSSGVLASLKAEETHPEEQNARC